MATISDLKKLNKKPRSFQEWLDNFDDEARAEVESAIMNYPPREVHAIISVLDFNPYPFECKSLYQNRLQLMSEA